MIIEKAQKPENPIKAPAPTNTRSRVCFPVQVVLIEKRGLGERVSSKWRYQTFASSLGTVSHLVATRNDRTLLDNSIKILARFRAYRTDFNDEIGPSRPYPCGTKQE